MKPYHRDPGSPWIFPVDWRPTDPEACEMLAVHQGARDVLEANGLGAFLNAHGWRPAADGAPAALWTRDGEPGAVDPQRALLVAMSDEMRAWLERCGWCQLPDGSSINAPAHRGLVDAARMQAMDVSGPSLRA